MMDVLERFKLLPAIFFLKSRAECDAALGMCAACRRRDRGGGVHSVHRGAAGTLPLSPEPPAAHNLQTARVAAHHGGQLPAWKFLVETMMKRGCLKAIFATSTVAAGVNFPARTIVLMNSDLFNGHDFAPLSGTEFHQMTGRAGRRGQDRVGFMLRHSGALHGSDPYPEAPLAETGSDRKPDPERLFDGPEPPPLPDAGGHPGDLREIPGHLPAAQRRGAGTDRRGRSISGGISSAISACFGRRASSAMTTG